MFRRSFTYGLGLLALLFAGASQAAVEYWIAVASYRDLDDAESARSRASEMLPESFSVSQVELDSGLWFRVLAGPYLTRDIADHILSEATRNGFDRAWMLSAEAAVVSGADYTLSDPSLAHEYRVEDYGADLPPLEPIDTDSERYSVPASEPANIPGFNAPVRPDRSEEHKLIDEAPDGYQLHELSRDQT